MKVRCTSTLLGLLAFSLLARATTPQALPVAVFDFESKDEGTRDLGPKVAALINVYLTAQPSLVPVERAELDKVLSEQELGLSGAAQPESAAKLGHLTGAKVLVTGRVFKVEQQLFLVCKIIGSETGRVYAEMVKGAPGTAFSDLATDLAKKIAATIRQNQDTLLAHEQSPEQRLASLKKALPDKARPTVSLSIAERHFGRPVIDPAAETELGLLLQQCGFTLVTPESGRTADIQLSGEAFSAFALQKGNLVSCKARIELKALKSNHDLLAVDRETEVAIDVTEQTAAKTALQKAAFDLAERLIPRLAK